MPRCGPSRRVRPATRPWPAGRPAFPRRRRPGGGPRHRRRQAGSRAAARPLDRFDRRSSGRPEGGPPRRNRGAHREWPGRLADRPRRPGPRGRAAGPPAIRRHATGPSRARSRHSPAPRASSGRPAGPPARGGRAPASGLQARRVNRRFPVRSGRLRDVPATIAGRQPPPVLATHRSPSPRSSILVRPGGRRGSRDGNPPPVPWSQSGSAGRLRTCLLTCGYREL